MRSAVSIYILIPLLLVPQLILGGAMIRYDDLHQAFSKKIYVPLIGDIMVTRWAYEALSVEQFRGNDFEKPFFKYDMEISQNDWEVSFLIPTLKVKADECLTAGKNPDYRQYSEENFRKLNIHINELSSGTVIPTCNWITRLNYDHYNDLIASEAKATMDSMRTAIRLVNRMITQKRDSLYNQISGELGEEGFVRLRERNYNESLNNILLNRMSTNKIYDSPERLIQKSDPVFMKPGSKYGRAHFFAPYKLLGNVKMGTLLFNVIAIWMMVFILFITLYYNVLKRFVGFLESLKLPIWRKFGRDFLPDWR
jgi:hypothetical protein